MCTPNSFVDIDHHLSPVNLMTANYFPNNLFANIRCDPVPLYFSSSIGNGEESEEEGELLQKQIEEGENIFSQHHSQKTMSQNQDSGQMKTKLNKKWIEVISGLQRSICLKDASLSYQIWMMMLHALYLMIVTLKWNQLYMMSKDVLYSITCTFQQQNAHVMFTGPHLIQMKIAVKVMDLLRSLLRIYQSEKQVK